MTPGKAQYDPERLQQTLNSGFMFQCPGSRRHQGRRQKHLREAVENATVTMGPLMFIPGSSFMYASLRRETNGSTQYVGARRPLGLHPLAKKAASLLYRNLDGSGTTAPEALRAGGGNQEVMG